MLHLPPTRRLELKLARRDCLSADESAALAEMAQEPFLKPAGAQLVEPGDRPEVSTLLLSGFAARYSELADGRRQYTQINCPGDFVDLHSFVMRQMDHGVLCLSPCLVSAVPHDRLRRITQDHPHLTRLLWLETVVDAAIHREWLLAMGQQTALERLALFLCEMQARLDAVGLVEDGVFDLPIRQQDLADFLGMSPVHLNRTLQILRETGWISWKGAQVRVIDRQRLIEAAEFDDTYLRLERSPV